MQNITIKESHIVGKRSAEMCEDGIVATADHIAVIDGSTSKSAHPLCSSMSNGQLAMTILKEVIGSLPPAATLEQFCQRATARLQEEYQRHGFSRERLMAHPEERLTASVALFSRHYGEVWLVGDCQCLYDGTLHENPKPREASIAERRSQIANMLISSGEATVESLRHHDIARDAVVGDIVASCHRQNIDFPVVDGFDIPLDKVKVIKIKKAATSDIVLSTDGYPFLHPTLAESEASLAHLLALDPLCITLHKATKGMMEGYASFDDRAYIRIGVV